MSENSTNTELLIRYLDKELSDAELASLEASLPTRSDLQQELQQLTQAKNAVKHFGLKSQVARIHAEMMKEMEAKPATKAPVVSLFKWTMRIAAGLFLVMLTGALYLYFSLSGMDIYNSKYSEYTLSTSRSAESSSAIVDAYKAKDYSKIIELNKFFKSTNPEALFLTGMAYLQTNQNDLAIQTLQALLAQKDPAFKEDAEYYLALTYIKLGKTEDAIPLFRKINQDKLHPYHDKVSDWDIRKLELVQWKQ